MAKKKRGGQKGNVNALKHGFFAKTYEEDELIDLEAIMAVGLDSEIAMLRVVMRRYLVFSKGVQDLDTLGRTVELMGMAATRLAGLLKVKRYLGGGEDEDLLSTINQAIEEITEELGLSL